MDAHTGIMAYLATIHFGREFFPISPLYIHDGSKPEVNAPVIMGNEMRMSMGRLTGGIAEGTRTPLAFPVDNLRMFSALDERGRKNREANRDDVVIAVSATGLNETWRG